MIALMMMLVRLRHSADRIALHYALPQRPNACYVSRPSVTLALYFDLTSTHSDGAA